MIQQTNNLPSGSFNQQKKPVTVVDARMGRGKSSAAIRYMNEYKDSKRFLYITPFLDEVDRVCERCSFDQSDGENASKSVELKELMRADKNIAATHALFYLMDKEALQLARSHHYSLIVDESLSVAQKINLTPYDVKLVVEHLTDIDENGLLQWNDDDYTGVFADCKELAESHRLVHSGDSLLRILDPNRLRVFDEVFLMTYLFEGQYQKAYLEYFDFEYRVVGIKRDDEGYLFSDVPDVPEPVDYHALINIFEDRKTDKIGLDRCALSKAWYARRGHDNKDIKALRNGMVRFFRSVDGGAKTRLWTTFKDSRDKLVESDTGRFSRSFLQVGARAVNSYRECYNVAYLANRFIDPRIANLFAARGITIDRDKFALSEMLQWIWRSAIRDDKPINLYIPSKRMRDMLLEWMDTQAGGEVHK